MNNIGKQIVVLEPIVDADLFVVDGERTRFDATFLKEGHESFGLLVQ